MRKADSRKNYTLKPKIAGGVTRLEFVLFPTVVYHPWRYRPMGFEAVSFMWLCFYIGFGSFEKKPERGNEGK